MKKISKWTLILEYTFSILLTALSVFISYKYSFQPHQNIIIALLVLLISFIGSKLYNDFKLRTDILNLENDLSIHILGVSNNVNKTLANNLREFVEILKNDCCVKDCQHIGSFCQVQNKECVYKDFIDFEINRFCNVLKDIEDNDKYILDSGQNEAHETVFKSIKLLQIQTFNVVQYLDEDENMEFINQNEKADIAFFNTLIKKENVENLTINWLFVVRKNKKDNIDITHFYNSYKYFVEILDKEVLTAEIRSKFKFKVVSLDDCNTHITQSKDKTAIKQHLHNLPDFGLYGDKFVYISEGGYFIRGKNEVLIFQKLFNDLYNQAKELSFNDLLKK